jgi:hypothetical protein
MSGDWSRGKLRMQVGDLVRLKQPFRPSPDSLQEYSFGIVVGLGVDRSQGNNTPEVIEVILYLYDPDTSTPYIDEFGVQAMYSFYPEELES